MKIESKISVSYNLKSIITNQVVIQVPIAYSTNLISRIKI